MNTLKGSMETLSALQITQNMEGLDVQSKIILRNPEVLAVILQEAIEEYKGYSWKEIMGFIEPDSITDQNEVSPGRTNTLLGGEATEFVQLNEKTSNFDLAFRAKNPCLSTEGVLVNLHIDLEPQKTYRPGYPIEKRGMYYLARRLSSQLSLATERTDYRQLEKCYSIWICRDDIPKEAHYSISVYEMANTKNSSPCSTAKENYDLMTLVIIKLGNRVYNGSEDDEGYGLFRFLNAIMYPHTETFMNTMNEYIDFSDNEELWREVTHMGGLGQSVFEEGREEGIQALILDNLEEEISKERILQKLQKHFNLPMEKAENYYERFAQRE